MVNFWLQDPAALFESFCIWPFNTSDHNERANALVRLMLVISVIVLVIVPQATRNLKSIGLLFLMANVLLGVVLANDSTDPDVSLLYTPDSVSGHNPYNNPLPFNGVRQRHNPPAVPDYGYRPGNILMPSDGLRFHPVPDRTMMARWRPDGMPHY